VNATQVTPTLLAAAHPVYSTSTGEAATFWILAPVAVLAALGMVLARNAVHGALLLVANFFCLAVFYMMQDAPFLGFVQIIVYAGAIMVLFLFVLMLVGVDSADSLVETLRGQRVAAIVLGLGFAGLLVFPIGHVIHHQPAAGLSAANTDGNVQAIAKLLFTDYVFPFEVVSALLIVAAVGAMVLGHRERVGGKITQRDRMRARFAEGRQLTPLPGPGVYARADAANNQARLPGGATSPATVMAEFVGGTAEPGKSGKHDEAGTDGPPSASGEGEPVTVGGPRDAAGADESAKDEGEDS
jgi:NADH-quinone oxidoreductase subunit J